MFLKQYSHRVGVDIHENEIRLIHLKKSKKNWTIITSDIQSLPKGSIVDGKIKNFSSVSDALQKAVMKTHTQNLPAVIGLPFSQIITKNIELKKSDSNSYEKNISRHLKNYFPNLSDNVCFDFIEVPSTEININKFLLIACKEELLNLYQAVIAESSLQLKIIETDLYALIRIVMHSVFIKSDSSFVIIYKDISMTHCVVLEKNIPIFQQQWLTGDESYTRAQLERSLQLCLSTHLRLDLKNIVLVGELHDVSQVFSTLSIPVQSLNPLARFNGIEGTSVSLRLIISAGLAMRDLNL